MHQASGCGQRTGGRAWNESIAQKGLQGLTVLLAAFYIAGGAAFTVGYVSGSLDWEAGVLEAVILGAIPFTAAAMDLAGLLVAQRAPQLGTALVSVGVIAMAAVWFWMFLITVPVGLLVIGFAVFRARRFVRERDRIATA